MSGSRSENWAESAIDSLRCCTVHSVSQSKDSGEARSEEELFMFDFPQSVIRALLLSIICNLPLFDSS